MRGTGGSIEQRRRRVAYIGGEKRNSQSEKRRISREDLRKGEEDRQKKKTENGHKKGLQLSLLKRGLSWCEKHEARARGSKRKDVIGTLGRGKI